MFSLMKFSSSVKKKIEELVRIADELDINIFCYGLLTDFKGVLFEGSKRLIECADSIREIVNSCPLCEKEGNKKHAVIRWSTNI